MAKYTIPDSSGSAVNSFLVALIVLFSAATLALIYFGFVNTTIFATDSENRVLRSGNVRESVGEPTVDSITSPAAEPSVTVRPLRRLTIPEESGTSDR